jgi:nitrite reductase (NO-forming)
LVRAQEVAAKTAAAGHSEGSSDHSGPLPEGQDKPKPSGELASVYDAALPPLDPNPSKTLVLDALDVDVEIGGGVTMKAWTFGGTLPAPVIRMRQGDSLDFTLRNKSQMGHSIDFHAARTPWDKNYVTIMPDEEIAFTWTADYPGVFMYHCGTGPVLQHIANGMYGTVIVDPPEGFAPAREYVLVQSEYYVTQNDDGTWEGSLDKMRTAMPDLVVFNGAANQYQQEPLQAGPGELIRLHVMNAGPTLFSAFHVIGALFDKVYVEGNPANVLRGIQTWTIPPGGGATFELVIPEAGQYPFVTHAFAFTGLGAVGLINVA